MRACVFVRACAVVPTLILLFFSLTLSLISLMKIKEAGIVERLARKWFPEKPGCQGDETTAMPVSLQLVQTAFIVVAVGVALGATVLVLERFMITFQRIANSPCYNDAED